MKSGANSDSRAAAITKAAADWIARCDRGLTPEEAEQFAHWENAHPRHRAELARLSETWTALNTVDEIPEVMTLARGLEDATNRPRRPWYFAAFAGSGIAAALLLAAWAFWRSSESPATNSPSSLTTATGYKVVASTARRLTLIDGTTVELNGDSVVEPAFTAEKRLVRLLHGEANFNVAKDPRRPFVVQANNVAVQAVGTTFNVLLDPNAVHVLVTEGRVRVDNADDGKSLLSTASDHPSRPVDEAHGPAACLPFPLLVAGERVIIPASASAPVLPSVLSPAELEHATRWQATQLIFSRTLLKDAVAAFNSFNQRQLVLGDAALGQRLLGGTFRADNVDAFIWLLETGFEIEAQTDNQGRTVLRAMRR